ncbi:Hypp5311 [Branchiostoma lanceolatum]|uniref:Hypp5311 protein n=1 Tax=Branchiostoma lanceolatum TaxID=7740 RepID=A0A8K0AFJ1_BRALA|nr:Hypp5311 [Branchiostoma lanceolatum]
MATQNSLLGRITEQYFSACRVQKAFTWPSGKFGRHFCPSYQQDKTLRFLPPSADMLDTAVSWDSASPVIKRLTATGAS